MKQNNHFNRITIGLLLVVIAVFSPSCSEEPSTATLKLELKTMGNTSRVLVPAGTPLDVTRYVISGTGPQGSTFSIESSSATVAIEGLLIGTWNLTAVGQNKDGIDLIKGTTTFQLTPSPPTATIVLDQLLGTGTARIHFSWDTSRIQAPRFELDITPQGGTKQTISPTSCDLTAGTATYNATHSAGSYTFQAKLYSNDTVVAGCAEVVRIVGNKITEGSIVLDLDKTPDSPGSLRLINKLGVPIDCTISGIASEVSAMTATTATLEIPSTLSQTGLSINWYLDGASAGHGTSFTFVPKAGEHRLDVVAEGSMLASAGSASYNFRAIVNGTAGVPLLVTELSNGTAGLNLSGATRTICLPDGKLLISNNSSNTLQIARLVRDNLELIQTYSNSATHSTNGISDMLCIPQTDYIVTAEATEPGVTLYEYNSEAVTLTKKYHRNGTISADKQFTKTSSLFYDSQMNVVFVIDPTCSYAAGNNLAATTESEWKYGWMTWRSSLTIPFTKATKAATSPGDQSLAVISNTENSLKIMRRNSMNAFGNDCYLNYSTSGATGLSGVRAVGFSDDNNVITGSNTMVTRFSYVEGNVWEQKQTIKVGSPAGVTALQAVEQILLHPNGKYLYVISSGSKNVNCFTMSTDGTLNFIGALDCGTFVPTHGTITANGEYLILTSDTSNKLLLTRIPK